MSASSEDALPDAVSGARHYIDGPAGRIGYYSANENAQETPLLFVHTVNAAGGAHEIRPLFEHYRQHRPVYAFDLPGFGISDRESRRYEPRLMTNALHAMIEEIRSRHGDVTIDALAASLSSEFLARAAQDTPAAFRSVALVSPTGLNRRGPFEQAPESNRGMGWLYKVFMQRAVGPPLYRLLTRPRIVRYFLERTWGSKHIDEEMFEYSCLTARQPGAHHAPFSFLSGYLFSADITRVYRSLEMPVWMSHGVRGDFTDYRNKDELVSKPNWQYTVFQTGALPYFEEPDAFTQTYDEFLAEAAQSNVG